MRYLCLVLIFFWKSEFTLADDNELFSLNFGPVKIGESKIPIDLNNFTIKSTVAKIDLITEFVSDSIQWIRTSEGLLTPRLRLRIKVPLDHPNVYFKYLGRSLVPQQTTSYAYSEIYSLLFSPSKIEVYENEELKGSITIVANKKNSSTKFNLIDHSCYPYQLKIRGLEEEYLSASCRMETYGEWGKEQQRLEVYWTTTNFRLPNLVDPPYMTVLLNGDPAKIEMRDSSGVKTQVEISGTVPERFYRLKTAVGFGPYTFKSKFKREETNAELTASFMVYSNFTITKGTSLRAFDAFVYRKSLFNNLGLYFAYEIAEALDNRISIVPLLGLQTLTYRYDSGFKKFNKIIYPQGIEILYKHAFGLQNYNFVYGMFISTNDSSYKNIWIRMGKKIFWELNYINWQAEEQRTQLLGLSVGIPFASFF